MIYLRHLLLILMLNNLVVFFVFSKNRIDFGDFSSNTLITKASEALNEKDWKSLKAYSEKCIQLYSSQAKKMQKNLKDYPEDNESLNYWALNHVAYSHFMLAEMYLENNDEKKAYKEYQKVVEDYSFSKCFDPNQNIFWKIADKSKSKQAGLINKYGENYFQKNNQKKMLDPKAKLRPLK